VNEGVVVREVMRRVLAVVAAFVLVMSVPGVALAHGAPASPASRAFACGPEGASAAMAACKAAIALSGTLTAWDNIRVANVAGRDRTMIPDGKLCSGGLDRYRGLDLPRADWPSTPMTPGAAYLFRYRATIAHPGTFQMYITTSGYDPTRALRWADLDAEPFLTATNPPRSGDAYVMDGRVPASRFGRQLIFTIWRNSGPDTYYSCSDVDFPAAPKNPPAASNPVGVPPVNAAAATPQPTSPATAPEPAGERPAEAEAVAQTRPTGIPRDTITAIVVVVLVLIGAAILFSRARRRSRPAPGPGNHRSR
jgi:predicted carbohydrate-binding protein with CBM5 and CBM33 domain